MHLEEVTRNAMQLPVAERIVLAESLLLTVEDQPNPPFDEATIVEMERRLKSYREAKVVGIPAEQVLREIRESLSA